MRDVTLGGILLTALLVIAIVFGCAFIGGLTGLGNFLTTGKTVAIQGTLTPTSAPTVDPQVAQLQAQLTAQAQQAADAAKIAANQGGGNQGGYMTPTPIIVNPTQTGGNSQTGGRVLTTAQAKAAIGLDVQRLNDEIGDAFVWRDLRNSTNAICSQGWICTLHLATGDVKVYVGDGTSYSIFAGTFRFVSSYPSNDAVHTPCDLLGKEQRFGAKEDPSFPVFAGNFTCGGGAATPVPSVQSKANSGNSTTGTCPQTANEVANLIGGSASYWTEKTDDGNKIVGWSYKMGSPAVTMTAPYGRVDYWDGKTSGQITKGQSASNVTQATFWCFA